ncbi:hypothetical protein H0H93_008580, partial [Arthromyces matolae]
MSHDWKKLWDEYVQMKLPLYLDQPSTVKDAQTPHASKLSSQEIKAEISKFIGAAEACMRAGDMLTNQDQVALRIAEPIYAGALDLYRRVVQLDPRQARAILKLLKKEFTDINPNFPGHSDFVKAVKDLMKYCQTKSNLPLPYTPKWPYRAEAITHDYYTQLMVELDRAKDWFLRMDMYIVDILAVTALDLHFQWAAVSVHKGNLVPLMDYIDGVKVDSKATPYVQQCADLIHPYYAKLEEFARIYHATAWTNRRKVKKDLAELWEAYWGMEVPL